MNVTVSIVNWNTRDALARCLDALLRDTSWQGGIVVVDNASSDGSAEMVRQRFPTVQLIASKTNDGFAAANNRAMAVRPADYFLVLNPDVAVPPGAIGALVEFMEGHPRTAAAAPALVGDDGALQPHLYRRFPSVPQIVLSWTVLSVITSRISPLRRRIAEHDIRGDEPIRVDQVPGAAMLIRRSALETVGPMDPGYFIWFEDVDWCYRARRAGLDIHVVPQVRVLHEGGASFGRWSLETRAFQFYRAFFRFLCRHDLTRLIRVALPVLSLDLRLKGAILRVRRMLGMPVPGAVETLAPTRAAMRDVVRRWRAGEIVDFTSADVPVRDMPAVAQPPVADTWNGDDAVDVVIVNWNGRRWLQRCIDALRASSVPLRIVLVDNASTDDSCAWVRTHHPDITIIALEQNLGYAAGANIGLRLGRGRYAMVMNPDVQLAPDHLASLRERLDADASIGAAQGKLLQIAPDDFLAGRYDRARTIDSAGHEIARTRMVVDRGQGKPDDPAYDTEASVFSACGAALFLRRVMLEDVAPDGEYFGEAFFAYKEDIDLGWRARLRGWDVRYVPAAVAWHVRGAPLDMNAWRSMPLPIRRHSWKNHYLLMIRNDRVPDIVRALPFVLGWEIVRFGYALLRDPRVLGGYVSAFRELGSALRARRQIHASRRAAPEQLRRWFGAHAAPVRDIRIPAVHA